MQSSNSALTDNNFTSSFKETLQVYTLKPLQAAKVIFDFRDLPDGFKYNEHFTIVIRDRDDKEMQLPYYFDTENNAVTNKRTVLEVRVFNWQTYDILFKVGIDLYHGLFQPYLKYLKDKVQIQFYNAHRQQMFQNYTYGLIIAEQQIEGITIPYNTPDVGSEPEFVLDMTATGQDINPVRQNYDTDPFDSTFWQSKQIQAAVMPWIPYFSNCKGYDSRIIVYDIIEYNDQCELPNYNDIRIVNPIPSTGLDPVADKCNIVLECIYDEPVFSTVSSSTRWYQILEQKDLFYITREPIDAHAFRMTNGDCKINY